MSPVIANESELYVAPGGPAFRFVERIGLARHIRLSVARRIGVLLLVTWVPMCVFALIQGVALGPTPRQSFLLDFATYARFFIGIPILILAEHIVGARLHEAGLQFVRDGLVRPADYPGFERAIARLARRRESGVATLVIVGLASFGAWELTFESLSGVDTGSWRTIVLPEGSAFRYNLAALWSHVVALPVLLFLWYRWLWRILFWTLFLRDVARLDLRLVPTHADAAGGLSFLERAHDAFAILALAIGSILSAEAAFRSLYEGATPSVFQMPVFVVGAVVLIVFLGPMLVFTPVMARTRQAALAKYGSLVARHNRDFEDKWVENAGSPTEAHLGSQDNSSLADLGTSFGFIRHMRYVPFGYWSVVYMVGALLLPAVPLVLLVVPLEVIIGVLTKVAL